MAEVDGSEKACKSDKCRCLPVQRKKPEPAKAPVVPITHDDAGDSSVYLDRKRQPAD